MSKRNSGNDDLHEDVQAEEVGDVETAGETTAAATISGNTNEKPVGADTLVKTRDEAKPEEGMSS